MLARIALGFAGCLFFVGCAEAPQAPKEIPVDEDTITVPARGEATASDGSDGDLDLPVTPVESADTGKATPDLDTPTTPATGTGTTTTTKPGTGTAAPQAKTQSCTSVSGDYKALTTITYTVTDGTAKVSKMTVAVTNPSNRDENDADVFVNDTKAFNSGDILKHGQAVTLTQANTLSIKSGTKLKIETNFDRKLLTDPSAACTIQF